MDNSTGKKKLSQSIGNKMLVKIVSLREGRKHNSKIAFPDYRSTGLNLYATKCNGSINSRDNRNHVGFLG